MRDKNLTPWWGLANLETDEPPTTHCGKSVDPVRLEPHTVNEFGEVKPLEIMEKIQAIRDARHMPEWARKIWLKLYGEES